MMDWLNKFSQVNINSERMNRLSSNEIQQIYQEIFEESKDSFNFEKLRNKISQIKEIEKSKMEKLSYFIKNQLDSFENTTSYLQFNLENIEKIQAKIMYIKSLSLQNQPTVDIDPVVLKKLLITKKNLSRVVELMGDFLNITGKLEEMEMLVTDSNNYFVIQTKLETLLNLEQIISNSTEKKENYGKFAQKFEEVHVFQNKFLRQVMEVFKKYLAIPRSNPESFKNAIRIVEINDQTTNSKQFWKEMIGIFEDSVRNRFDEKLADKDQVHLVLENINFSVDDLLIIHEFVSPLFGPEAKIFEFFEDNYKTHIQKRILPFLKDLNFLKENPGTLVYLFNWLSSYEKLLAKVGFVMGDFNNLRVEIKKSLPIFFNHLSDLLKNFLNRISTNDDKLFSADFQFDLTETSLPDDIAIFLNQQIDFLATQIQGELFSNIFQTWSQQIIAFVDNNVIW